MTTARSRFTWLMMLCLCLAAAAGPSGPLSLHLAMAQEKPSIAELDPALDVNRVAADGLDWHDVTEWGVEGRILPDQPRLRWFDCLPNMQPAEVTQKCIPLIQQLRRAKGDALYGTDSEGATDASHASDLGFMRQAEAFAPILRAALTPTKN